MEKGYRASIGDWCRDNMNDPVRPALRDRERQEQVLRLVEEIDWDAVLKVLSEDWQSSDEDLLKMIRIRRLLCSD